MSRASRRGKGPKDQTQLNEQAHEPSRILSSMLKTLDLTFERDIGMLNGKHVRSVPDKTSLSNLKASLEKLDKNLESIVKSDEETLNLIRGAKEAQKQATELPSGTTNVDAVASDEDAGVVPTKHLNRKRSLKIEDEEDQEEVKQEKPATPNRSHEHADKKAKIMEKSEADIDKIENDPSVKNPKSEFVVSQTLPAAAVSLGLFSEHGLESTGEDYLKKKYGVASYPTSGLENLLPGEIPDMDFSRPKPTNQIQYSTFLSSIDNFFREFTEEDIKFLQNRHITPTSLQVEKSYDPEVTPYIIPRMGPVYTDVWFKEDSNQNIANLSPPPLSNPVSILPKKSSNDLSDDVLDTEEVSCGPLVSRLLSAILKDGYSETNSIKEEADTDGTSMGDEDAKSVTPAVAAIAPTPDSEFDEAKNLTSVTSALPQQQGWRVNTVNLDYPSFEERLKRELKYVGIYMNLPRNEDSSGNDDPDWVTGREDDEISGELRELQNELRQVTKKNIKRKATLIPLVERQLAWQEYSSILDDLDKQVDQAYIKRIRVPKNKKKKLNISATTGSTSQAALQAAHQQAANSSLKSLLDKRQRWISKIGPLFDKPEVMKRLPKESVFRDLDQEEEEEEGDVFGNNGNGKDDELTDSLQNKDE